MAASVLSSAPAPEALSLRDEAFDPANLPAYHLLALAAPARLRVAVLDAARHKVVAFDDQPLPSAPADLPAALDAHELLGRPGWGRLRLGLAGRAFTLLPAPLLRPGDEAAYLAPHHPPAPHELALAYPLPQPAPATDVVGVFAASTSLHQWLQTHYGPSARLLPQPLALLAGWQQQRGPAQPSRQLYLSLADGELTAAVLGSRLEFCNVFPFSTPEDVVYYAILVMQELGLSPDQDQVTLWGEVAGDSAVFALLSTYIRHLRFGARPFALRYTYRLNDLAEHRHFDLFSLALVE